MRVRMQIVFRILGTREMWMEAGRGRPSGGHPIWCVMGSVLSPVIANSVRQNEYSKQLRELRAQDKSGKAQGKVFVRGE